MMEIYEALILGIIQGITEWLPVSSSGHLILFKEIFGLEQDVFFDMTVHIGSLMAITWFFRGYLWSVFHGLITRKKSSRQLILAIIAAFIPTAFIGFGLSMIENSLQAPKIVGFGLLFSALLLFLSGFYNNHNKSNDNDNTGIKHLKKNIKVGAEKNAHHSDQKKISLYHGFLIGIFQGLAVIPGISRSGSTIAAGRFVGLESTQSARFSFLIFIPAILAALGYKIMSMMSGVGMVKVLTGESIVLLLIGLVTSAIVGYLTIGFLMRIVRKINYFWVYCALLGLTVLIFM
ncbi:undecaprenyl-diphosphate phosphatase [Candidatus Woesearchaeota archaeon]|nr:undecaprenyl-diphosphate phosphatase [Candidatus Woesearchaeota archaeon]